MRDATHDPKNHLDCEVLTQLRRSGSHLSQAHVTEFYLYFPRHEQAERASVRVRDRGYPAIVESCAISGQWLVLAKRTLLLTSESLAEARSELSAIAGTEGGIYDGWATRLVKGNPAGVGSSG